MQPNILVLGLEREAGPACLAQAAARKIGIIAADTEESLGRLREFAAGTPPAGTVAFDYRDREAAVAAALALHSRLPLHGVFSYREFGLESAAAISEALSLPGNPLAVVQLTRNKARLKARLREAGLHQPPSYLCNDTQELLSAFRSAPRGRWIVKPCALSGSIGVCPVEDEASLVRAAEVIQALDGHGGMLLEGFIEGPEFSVEGIVHRGQAHVFAITEKLLFGGASFVERGHLLPAPLPEGHAAAIREAAVRALEAAGVWMGHFHVEVFVTRQGVVVGEVHTRVGGDWIDLLVEESLGIELYGLALDQLLGRELPLAGLRPLRAAAVRFLQAPPGVVRGVHGVEEARRVAGVVRVDINDSTAVRGATLGSSYERAGSFVLRAAEAGELRQRLDEVEALIRFDTTPEA